MAACANHPGAETTAPCAACRQPFCGDCTVNLRGIVYCGSCKNRAVHYMQQKAAFSDPRDALALSILSVMCLGCAVVVAPFAIYRANRALQRIRREPYLPGKELAVIALVLSIICLILDILGVVGIALFGVAAAGAAVP